MRTLLGAAAIALLIGCQSAATSVEVVTSTDAPGDRAMVLTAEVRREGGPVVRRELMQAARVEGNVPVSFGLLPSTSDRHAAVTVRLEAFFPAQGALAPRTISRVAHFEFVEHAHTQLPMFLSWRCGNETTGCRDTTSGACTVARLCEERGQTCDQTGECTSPEAMPIAVDAGTDASLNQFFDVARTDGAVDARDAAIDASVTDALDAAIDAVADTGVADATICAANARRCAGADLYVCNASGTAESFTTTCASAPLCATGTGSNCAAPACSAGQTRCNGSIYEGCNASYTGWNTLQNCGGACSASGCVAGVCTPGEGHCETCANPTSDDCYVHCRGDGSGWDTTDCGWGQPASCEPLGPTTAHCI